MPKQSVRMMKMDINETKKAFNVNGIAFSKDKLSGLFPGWECDKETFFRYLLIMPFFASSKEVEDAPNAVGKYAIAKAKRIFIAMGLEDDDNAVLPFMHICGELGNIKLPEELELITEQCHDNICNCGEKKTPQRRLH